MNVSACLITRDAERHLDACLTSLAWCREIVVRDDGSSDRTLEICARHGARVVTGPWLGFGPSKAAVVDEAECRWVLSIDADETVDETLRGAIESLPDEPPFAAYRVNRLSRFLGREIRHSGWHPDRIVRLFDTRRAGFDDRPVHESVQVQGPVGDLEGLLHHHAYDSVTQYLGKLDRYTTLGARDAVAQGRRSHPVAALMRAQWTFVRTYLLRRGYLDGRHGLALCGLMAFQTFVKYLKIWRADHRPTGESE